jgi:hypothetical protein
VIALPKANVAQREPRKYGGRVQSCRPCEFPRCLVQLFLFKQDKSQPVAQVTVIWSLNGKRLQRRLCLSQPSFRRHPQSVVDGQILRKHRSREKQKSGCCPVHLRHYFTPG